MVLAAYRNFLSVRSVPNPAKFSYGPNDRNGSPGLAPFLAQLPMTDVPKVAAREAPTSARYRDNPD